MAYSDLIIDSPSEDDDEDSAEVQARAYDGEHYEMEAIQEEWDNILMSSPSTSRRRLPALPSRSPTPQHRLDPLATDAAHPQTPGHTLEDDSVDWDECGGKGDAGNRAPSIRKPANVFQRYRYGGGGSFGGSSPRLPGGRRLR
jgi:hypothetical protein